MAKRRISKASKRRLSLFGPICLIAIVYFVFSLFVSDFYMMFQNIFQSSKYDKKSVRTAKNKKEAARLES